ncbi:YHS domain protein [Microbacterium sp. C448]|uniref:YHS domain-containing protein n=2 Tax=Microbacteriaceae TaxID=85023 RepID=A0A542YJK0_9MICO|nr:MULTISPECIES: YHS domain-containing protein [Microbacteriaceae]TQL48275.1 YHS domain-containing protein [Homoserinimonas aerilata]WEG10041.1 YHS domain-containing protein [Microbacterium sp. KACC 23027]CDK01187.1 YHS domain protein [Microbacterium sp. C448]
MSDSPTGSCCSHNNHGAVAAEGRTDLLAPSAEELAQCPVMAGSVVVKADAESAGLFRDYEGTRYYFCCAACGPRFDADPAKYAAAA